MLQSAPNAVDAHPLFDFETCKSFVPERRHRNLMPPGCKLSAKIGNMALFPTNRGRVELCEHQDTHWSLLAVESSLLLSSIAVPSIRADEPCRFEDGARHK